MKRLLTTCLAAVLLASSAATLAGGYRGHGHSSSNRGAYLAGGILLGSVLTRAFFPRPAPEVIYIPRPAPEVIYIERRPLRSPRVIYEESRTVVMPPAGRQLVRDLDGNCFERRFDRDGTELRSQIPATKCDW